MVQILLVRRQLDRNSRNCLPMNVSTPDTHRDDDLQKVLRSTSVKSEEPVNQSLIMADPNALGLSGQKWVLVNTLDTKTIQAN